MKKPSTVIIQVALILLSLSLTRTVFADVPQVRNVIVWNDAGHAKLNVTVYHNGEVLGHFVDTLSVVVTSGTNVSQSFPQSGPHTLDADTLTFNVTLDIGSVADTPLATVQAHCNLHGWSSQNWTGTVPEYSPTILLLVVLAITLIALGTRKARGSIRLQNS